MSFIDYTKMRIHDNAPGWRKHVLYDNQGNRATLDDLNNESPFTIGDEVICTWWGYDTLSKGRKYWVADCYVCNAGHWIIRVKRLKSGKTTGCPYYARNFKSVGSDFNSFTKVT